VRETIERLVEEGAWVAAPPSRPGRSWGNVQGERGGHRHGELLEMPSSHRPMFSSPDELEAVLRRLAD
jgi:hypothetical protein